MLQVPYPYKTLCPYHRPTMMNRAHNPLIILKFKWAKACMIDRASFLVFNKSFLYFSVKKKIMNDTHIFFGPDKKKMVIKMRMLLDQGVFECRISCVKSVKNDSPYSPPKILIMKIYLRYNSCIFFPQKCRHMDKYARY